MYPNTIEAVVVNGPYKGETVLIPRIPLIPTDKNTPIVFKRLQFPIKICYALTMNRVQSQTFHHVGIDFEKQPFTHGQLYVAITRITRPRNLKLHFPDENRCIAHNPVFTEVLHQG